VFQVARESVKEQVFDVGHLEAVKSKLKALLTSEMTPVSEMTHSSAPKDRSVEEEGRLILIQFAHPKYIASKLYLL
jgi:hypothetical protein